ncbi:MAG: hypothetical protein AB7N80_12680 [Bdellovibrionales bacterium]
MKVLVTLLVLFSSTAYSTEVGDIRKVGELNIKNLPGIMQGSHRAEKSAGCKRRQSSQSNGQMSRREV